MEEDNSTQRRMDIYLVVGILRNVLIPVVARTGLADLAEKEFQLELRRVLAELSAAQNLARDLLARHVDRSPRWTYPPSRKEMADEREHRASLKSYRVKQAILLWMAAHHGSAHTPGAVARELAGPLGLERSEFSGRLHLYKELGFLSEPTPGHFRAIGPLMTVSLEALRRREDFLDEFLGLVAPLSESYLAGSARAYYVHAKLPPDLWEALNQELLATVRAACDRYVAQGNEAGRDPAKELKGAVILAGGPTPWGGAGSADKVNHSGDS